MRESELRELHIVEATVVESFTEGYRLNTNHACQTSQPFNPFPSSFVVRTEGVSATLLSPWAFQKTAKPLDFDRKPLLEQLSRCSRWKSRVKWQEWKPILGLTESFIGSENGGTLGNENAASVFASLWTALHHIQKLLALPLFWCLWSTTGPSQSPIGGDE